MARLVPLALLLGAAAMWGALILSGLALIRGVEGQHVPCFPNLGQIQYYLVIPATALLALILGGAWWLRTGKRAPAVWLSVLSLLALPVYILFYGGGV